MANMFELVDQKIWVPGSRGMVGSALIRRLSEESCQILGTTRDEVELTDFSQVQEFYKREKPQVVLLSAAKVGGIHANNTYPVDFLSQNLQIQQNVIMGAHTASVKKLLFLGSSCIYPKECPQPIREEYLLTGPLEPTNQWYAIAKIAGLKLCQAYRKQYGCDFITAMPTNLYGPNDNFHSENSHVPAALLKRFHGAKTRGDEKVVVWGSGQPMREFLHVDDLADACVFLLKNYSQDQPLNIGTGEDISIADFGYLMKQITGFRGRIEFDPSQPEGTRKKLLDVSKIKALGWESRIGLKEGLKQYYDWYKGHQANGK